MKFSNHTITLLQQLEDTSRGTLTYRDELGLLIELANGHDLARTLDELSFFSKFAYKTFGIMQRIGRNAEGYDRLSKEFGESVEQSKKLIEQLLLHAPADEKKKFTSALLVSSPTAFQQLLIFFHDLSWYKNLRIDSRTRS